MVPKEQTMKVDLAEIAFPHLPWHFYMVFGSLARKCSWNSLGGSTRGSENRIAFAEELFG